MDNIGDWLYIVLLIVAGVSSLFGSGAKKKKRTAVPPSYPEQETTTTYSGQEGDWEWPRERPTQKTKRNRKETGRPAVSQKAFHREDTRLFPPSSTKPEPFLNEEIEGGTQRLVVSSAEEESGVRPEATFNDPAELRKAIICAEILNRKY